MRNDLEYPPAIIRLADAELGILAAKINNAHEAGEAATRKGLESFRQAGEMLLQAKQRVGHGRWLKWIEANLKVSYRMASRYMLVAENWCKLDPASNLHEALKLLSGDDKEEKIPSASRSDHKTDPEADDDKQGLSYKKADEERHKEPVGEPKKALVTNNTGNNEWYTPPEYLKAARLVLGKIDLDPASSSSAQRNVRAKTYYTKENDGLAQHWSGRIWLNPPYAKGLIDKFIEKLLAHYEAGDVSEAIVLTSDSTDTEWYHNLLSASAMICMVKGRVKFLDEKGEPSDAPRGQTLFYLGDNPKKFVRAFAACGKFLRLEKD